MGCSVRRYVFLIWVLFELLLFGGIMYGWGTLVFILKDEGIFFELCRENQTAMEYSIRRYAFLIWVLIEILSFGGIMYGWGALVYVLKDEGVFSELCIENQTYVECTERDEQFNLYFVISMSVGFMIPIGTSHCVAKLGTRTTRIITSLCFAVGCLLMAMADNDNPWLICVGGVFLAGFGITFQITSIQINVLFPKHSSTVIGLINGVFDCSTVVPLAIKSLYVNGVDRQTSFLILMGFSSITVISTFIFFPKTLLSYSDNKHGVSIYIDNEPKCQENATSVLETLKEQDVIQRKHSDEITKSAVKRSMGNTDKDTVPIVELTESRALSDEDDVKMGRQKEMYVARNEERSKTFNYEISVMNKSRTNDPKPYGTIKHSIPLHHCNDGENAKPVPEEDFVVTDDQTTGHVDKVTSASLKNSILNIGYTLHVLWFSILFLRFLYTIGTMNPKIEKLTHEDKKSVSYYTDVLSYAMFCGLVSSFGTGFLYDYQRSFFRHIVNQKRRAIATTILPLSVTSGLSMILSGLMFVQNEYILYVLPVIITVFRSVLFTVVTAFLVDMYPASQFEQLYAVVFFVANVFGFLQNALFQWTNAYADGEKHVSVTFVLLCCLTFVHPIYIYMKQRRII